MRIMPKLGGRLPGSVALSCSRQWSESEPGFLFEGLRTPSPFLTKVPGSTSLVLAFLRESRE